VARAATAPRAARRRARSLSCRPPSHRTGHSDRGELGGRGFIQLNEYVHIGFSARDDAFGSIFYGLTGLHGAHVTVGLILLAFANVRAWRGHFGPEAKDHLGVEVPGIYWHFVDVMWIIVFVSVYVL